MWRLAHSLRDRGHDPVIGCHAGSWIEDLARRDSITTSSLLPRNVGDLIGAVRVAAMLRRERFDLVHAHTGKLFAPLILAARLARKPIVLTYHLTCGRSPFTSRAMCYADSIIGVSDAVRNVLVQQCKLPPGKIRTLLTGIDLSLFRPLAGPRAELGKIGIQDGGPVFGAVNRLESVKRWDTFVHAAALVKQSHPEARYVILGEGPDSPQVHQMRKDLGLEQEFFLPGFVDNVPEILPELTALVLASDNEPFALVNLEAMASGIPVLASAAGGNAESMVPGKTGLLFPVGDANALAGLMRQILDDPERTREMGQAGRLRAEQEFAESRMMDQYEELYRQVIEESASKR